MDGFVFARPLTSNLTTTSGGQDGCCPAYWSRRSRNNSARRLNSCYRSFEMCRAGIVTSVVPLQIQGQGHGVRNLTNNTNLEEIDPKSFRRALGNFATGVTIITARGIDGAIVGVTASSFNSLSLDPPLILWSCVKESRSSPVFESAPNFAVNILAAEQIELSNHFARQQEDKFEGIVWQEGIGGVPILPDCAGRFQCETYAKYDGGDHWIFVGRVVAFDDFGRSPLCFHQGSYAMLFGHPTTGPKRDEGLPFNMMPERMANHTFFLMLRAVRAYQDRYQPKVVALGLSLIESRILLVLNDLPALSADELVVHLHAPITEAHIALQSLSDGGLVAEDGDHFSLTDAGRSKAHACWDIATGHADETFEDFSKEQIDLFTGVLRQLIAQGPDASL